MNDALSSLSWVTQRTVSGKGQFTSLSTNAESSFKAPKGEVALYISCFLPWKESLWSVARSDFWANRWDAFAEWANLTKFRSKFYTQQLKYLPRSQSLYHRPCYASCWTTHWQPFCVTDDPPFWIKFRIIPYFVLSPQYREGAAHII